MSLLEPRMTIRNPRPQTEEVMGRRAWWLVLLGFVLPGSAQVLAGNRKLGRIGLAATILMLVLAIASLITFFVNRAFFLSLVANGIGLTVLQVLAIGYGLLWLVLGLDTLRLAKIGKVEHFTRLGVVLLSLVLTLAPVGLAGYAASVLHSSRQLVNGVFQAQGPTQEPVDGHYTFMLLGGDSGADREGLRPDSVAVVTVDAETGAATMIGLPRNLMNAQFPADSPMASHWPDGFNCEECMLNAVYTYGMEFPELYPDAEANGSNPGIEATRDAVEGITGLEIQYYVLIDMQGFADLVDALGGVEIDVPRRIPIAITGGPVEEWIEPGVQVMDGYHALWYARSRADSSDYDRMERQRQVMEAVIRQFTPQTLLTRYAGLANAGEDFVSTDIPQSMIGHLADLAETTRTLPIERLEFVPPLIDTEWPDFELMHAEVQAAMTRATEAAKAQSGEQGEG